MKCSVCSEESTAIRVVNTLWWCACCGSMTDLLSKDVRVPTRSPFAQRVASPKMAAGLLLIASDAIARANRGIIGDASPLLILEDVLEALSAILEEVKAQGDEAREYLDSLQSSPEKLQELVERSIQRRAASR